MTTFGTINGLPAFNISGDQQASVWMEGLDMSEPGWIKCLDGSEPNISIIKHPTENKFQVKISAAASASKSPVAI
jgi:hypothetical protein